jgi:hypothetical protein
MSQPKPHKSRQTRYFGCLVHHEPNAPQRVPSVAGIGCRADKPMHAPLGFPAPLDYAKCNVGDDRVMTVV